MLKKRLGGMITVKDGWAVQSFGYGRYLPLGRAECLAENLDRWGADEIFVIAIDRSRFSRGPDLDLVRRIGRLGLSTPLTYGGGIRSAADAGAVIESGAERVCLDALLRQAPSEVRAIAKLVGAQAVIGVLPVSRASGRLEWRDYLSSREAPFAAGDFPLFSEGVLSEAMVVDWRHEGLPNAFDLGLIDDFPIDVPLIAFGGLTEPRQIAAAFGRGRVAACAVGNSLSYREHAIQWLRRGMAGGPIRPADFRAES